MINITIPDFVTLPVNELDQVKKILGVYVILDKHNQPLYVGKGDLFVRLTQHLKTSKTTLFRGYIQSVKYFEVWDDTERDIYETYLINTLKPPFNSSKVYSYDSYFAKKNYVKSIKITESFGSKS